MPTVAENPYFNYTLRRNGGRYVNDVRFSNPPAPLLQASCFRIRSQTQLRIGWKSARNEIRLLKWHNLFLLYIWRAVQGTIVKKVA